MQLISQLRAYWQNNSTVQNVEKPKRLTLEGFSNELLTPKLTAFSVLIWMDERDYPKALEKLDWVISQWRHVRYDRGRYFSDEDYKIGADVAAMVLFSARREFQEENFELVRERLNLFIEIIDVFPLWQRIREEGYYGPGDYGISEHGEEEELILFPFDVRPLRDRMEPLACTLDGKTPDTIPKPPRLSPPREPKRAMRELLVPVR
jgi:hypothetical protein